jgi:hypothetical protein
MSPEPGRREQLRPMRLAWYGKGFHLRISLPMIGDW